MASNEEPQPSPFYRLPVELVQDILEFIPSVSSLHAAILSCSLVYTVFLDAEETITTTVLLNQIDADVLPEAVMAFKSSQLRPHDADPKCREAILGFVHRNLE